MMREMAPSVPLYCCGWFDEAALLAACILDLTTIMG